MIFVIVDLSTFHADLTVEWEIMHVPALFEPAKVQCEIGDIPPMCHATCLSPICLDIALFFFLPPRCLPRSRCSSLLYLFRSQGFGYVSFPWQATPGYEPGGFLVPQFVEVNVLRYRVGAPR